MEIVANGRICIQPQEVVKLEFQTKAECRGELETTRFVRNHSIGPRKQGVAVGDAILGFRPAPCVHFHKIVTSLKKVVVDIQRDSKIVYVMDYMAVKLRCCTAGVAALEGTGQQGIVYSGADG